MARADRFTPLPNLAPEQRLASSPFAQVRLSASAGTGKTQVLSARVLRLLLHGVAPESILCLTFTKAGAAEMADRIHERLGMWVTMAGGDLASDLESLGEDIGPADRENARSLFARVLDARGSGLRIQTIHSFCQTLLAGFPTEAGMAPGFRPVEGREEQQLAAKALANMVERFDRDGRIGDLARLERLVMRLSEEGTRAFLVRCASQPDVLDALGSAIGPRVRRWLGLHNADVNELVRNGCTDGGFDARALRSLRTMLVAWGTSTARKRVEAIDLWLRVDVSERVRGLLLLHDVWAKKDGEPRSLEKGQAPPDPAYPDAARLMYAHFAKLIELQKLDRLADEISDALSIGQAYAQEYAQSKVAAGVADFNDLIRLTRALLARPGIGDWIRFKLDQAIDHILVDEAQDTNADQWQIVWQLAAEFFAGEGVKPDRVRTVFSVGDFKQAIFGFQGTDPREFERATDLLAVHAQASGQAFERLSLSESFRSSQPILDVTNTVIDELQHTTLGLPQAPDPHRSATAIGQSGSITLLPPVNPVPDDDGEAGDAEEGWTNLADLKWAADLARRVAGWTRGPDRLRLRNQGRDCEPGDVMILVRSRGDLARLIVSRLYQEGVDVAGVDRLTLGSPIAVQDLLACMRFALQPGNDLSLACVLVSPLVGWSQNDLLDRAAGRKGPLWEHLGDEKPAALRAMLALADRVTPYQFLEFILSDPAIDGRKRMIARLGEEARDPIEELLNAAIEFEAQATPSLQLFLDWFDRGDVQIKRDPAKPENAVRVMTVHGAKGLQAPVVVLADATRDPDANRARDLDWEPEPGIKVPLFRPRADERSGTLQASAEQQDQREREEHWRLLYVAMTRAEEHMFAGGALRQAQVDNGMSDSCWYVRLERALSTLGAQASAEGLCYAKQAPEPVKARPLVAIEQWTSAVPGWARIPAAPEARPPRPLAPSAIEIDDRESSPPPLPALRRAAERGILLHSLFERLPAVPEADRRAVGIRWLTQERNIAAPDALDLVEAAMNVIGQPGFADIFDSQSLAEVPLAGIVDGRVIAGTVDRLLVTETRVLVVDFKTGRRVPTGPDKVPDYHKAQMAAYIAVLRQIFPGRTIAAALLYTAGPALIEIDEPTLDAFKPGFRAAQQDLVDHC